MDWLGSELSNEAIVQICQNLDICGIWVARSRCTGEGLYELARVWMGW